MTKFITAFITVLALFPGAGLAAEARYDLTINISNLRSLNGDVHIALYDNPSAFPDNDGMITEKIIKAASATTLKFTDLKPGDYALAIYHDENGNHDFDQGFLGIPLEGYSFSNKATAFLGPPDFSDAKITLSDRDVSLTIPIRY